MLGCRGAGDRNGDIEVGSISLLEQERNHDQRQGTPHLPLFLQPLSPGGLDARVEDLFQALTSLGIPKDDLPEFSAVDLPFRGNDLPSKLAEDSREARGTR